MQEQDYKTLAHSKLTDRHRSDETFLAILDTLVEIKTQRQQQYLSIADAFLDIDKSEGKNLDLIGRLIGEERTLVNFIDRSYFGFLGARLSESYDVGYWYSLYKNKYGTLRTLTDEEYRRVLKARVVKNSSDNNRNSLLEVLNILADNDSAVIVESENNTAIEVRIKDIDGLASYYLSKYKSDNNLIPVPLGRRLGIVHTQSDSDPILKAPTNVTFEVVAYTDSDFKATYIKTDTSNPMWIDVGYEPENAIAGELHVDWGDGTKEVLKVVDYEEEDEYYIYLEHEYAVNGEYLIKVSSTTKAKFTVFGEITKVTDWGSPVNLQPIFSSNNLIEVPSTLHPELTSLVSMFSGCGNFNQDISMWDTSNVTNMIGMFNDATSFNQDISSWDTSKVTDMDYMFFGAAAFNQDISSWDVSNVISMRLLFREASSFNQDISSWDVSKVTNMNNMFASATAFNQDLSQWCVSNITSKPISFDLNAPLFTEDKHPVWGTCPQDVADDEIYFTTIAGTIEYMGAEGDQILLNDGNTITIATNSASSITVPSGKHKVVINETRSSDYVGLGGEALVELHNFPTLSSVTRFNFSPRVYNEAPNLTKVPTVLPPNITDIGWMFSNATAFNQDISAWDISNVTNMVAMFNEASSFNQPLNSWDVSHITSMAMMFTGAESFNQDISSWDTSNVTSMYGMFQRAFAFNQPLDSWDVSNVTDMTQMFYNAQSFNQPLNNWDVSNVTNMSYMFSSATSFNQDISGWDVSNVTNMGDMFYEATSFNQDLSSWCVTRIPSKPRVFDGLAISWILPRPVWGTCPQGDTTPLPNEMYFTTIAGNLNYFGVAGDQLVFSDGNTVTLDGEYLYDITVPSGKHKIVLVETRSHDYVGVSGEALVELHNFPTLSVVNVVDFCPNTSSPNLVKVPSVLPSNLTYLNWMFHAATSFNQDISMWDTSNITAMSNMFSDATSFNQDISSWNTSNVTNMIEMFTNATAFNQDIGGWDVSNVTDMGGMFYNTPSFNQDLSNWCVPNIMSEPYNFSAYSPLVAEYKPVWGTCPQ